MNTTLFAAILLAIIAFQAAALGFLGQPPICVCGQIKFWEGDVFSSGTSQHLSDWYSFTHLLHGVMFYFLLWFVARTLPVSRRFLLALGLEAGWEIIENLPVVIQLYRQQATAQGYVGDSIVNSLSDTLMMALGFIAAWRLPPRVTLALFIAIEFALAFAIRDNLTLNMLNLIHRFEIVDHWQRGA